MKILLINSSLTDGGSEKVMTLLGNSFVENGHDTEMILLRNKRKKNYKVSDKLKLIEIDYKYNNKVYIAIKRFFNVRNYIKNSNPDIIISFLWDINVFILLCTIGLNKKIIISERSLPIANSKSNLRNIMQKVGQRYIYNLADCIVLQTNDVAKYYSDKIQKKCVVIPNPIDQNLPFVDSKLVRKKIIAAGRFIEQKNFEMLIRVYANIEKKYPEYTLEIYGDGPLREKYKEMIMNYKIEDKVKLPGYVADINEKMKTAQIYVSTSNFEGISNSMLEALAIGIPCVCTDCPVGGAAMAIKNNVNGILIPVNDESQLLNSISELIENPTKRKQFSNESIKIRDEYSINKITNNWLEIINNTIGGNNARKNI